MCSTGTASVCNTGTACVLGPRILVCSTGLPEEQAACVGPKNTSIGVFLEFKTLKHNGNYEYHSI